MRVCIDPGHSGPYEPGVVYEDIFEADIVLAIALNIGDELEFHGCEVVYTRTGDIGDDGLLFRAEIANEAKADIFVSIHCNAADYPEAYGVETYYYPGSYLGRKLAANIQSKLRDLGYSRDRGIKEADFAVLRYTTMPAVLVECGFITSEQDRQILASDEGRQQIAAAIVSGIKTYFLE